MSFKLKKEGKDQESIQPSTAPDGKVIIFSHGATFKGKNMLPNWTIFFPLIVAPFKTWFPLR